MIETELALRVIGLRDQGLAAQPDFPPDLRQHAEDVNWYAGYLATHEIQTLRSDDLRAVITQLIAATLYSA
jgi:hypothetical protein